MQINACGGGAGFNDTVSRAEAVGEASGPVEALNGSLS
jgi:hypothetical protein